MCSSGYNRFRCVSFASVLGLTAVVSCESIAAIWWRSDRDRKRFDTASREQSACYSAEVRAVSAATRRRAACATGAFSPLLPSFVAARSFTLVERRGRESNPRIAVLQTATLPLGYPAVCVRDEINALV